jgi:membrane-associated phospholipid phosphatase
VPRRPLLSDDARRAIARFDGHVDTAFDRLRGNPVTDKLFYRATNLGEHGIIWVLLGAVRGLRSERDWHAAVRVGTGIAVESVLVNLGIKSLFRRTRPPWETERAFAIRRPLTSSFPSGHATSAFMAAVLLSDEDVLWPAYYSIAAVVAMSRVYVKIHHASDVAGGIGLGLLMGHIGKRLFPLPVASAESLSGSGG